MSKLTAESFETWATTELQRLLGFEQVAEIVDYISHMGNESEIANYLQVSQTNSVC